MARTEVQVNNAKLNDGVALTKTVMAAGATGSDGYAVTKVEDESLRLVIENEGSTGVFTIKAGEYCASNEDLNVVIGGGVSKAISFDGAAYRNKDATVYVDAGTTGALYAFQG